MSDLKIRETGLEWQQIDDVIVVLDTDRSVYLKLGGAAPALWPLLVQGATRPQLVDELTDRYEIEGSRAAADVDSFVESLRENGLL